MKVLLLGGTAEARELSHRLDALGDVEVVVSLAGRTSMAADHGGAVRVGGFDGVGGLEAHLRTERIDAIMDATHPFAATMTAHAIQAAHRVGLPLLRFERPPWLSQPGDRWTDVSDVTEAARTLPTLGAKRVLLTIGRTSLDAFADVGDVQFVVRSIEAVNQQPIAGVVTIRARGPFTLADETDLLHRHAIDAIVTKNSGGDDAKLIAARRLDIPVVMIKRPPGTDGITVDNLEDVLRWLRSAEHGQWDHHHRPSSDMTRTGPAPVQRPTTLVGPRPSSTPS